MQELINRIELLNKRIEKRKKAREELAEKIKVYQKERKTINAQISQDVYETRKLIWKIELFNLIPNKTKWEK